MAGDRQVSLMYRKACPRIGLFVIAGALSACNSAGNMHSQGPWGPSAAPRSYPEYSAPWGGPPAASGYGVPVQPVAAPPYLVQTDALPSRRVYGFHLEPELPPGPPIVESAFGVSSTPEPQSLPGQQASTHHTTSPSVQANAPGIITPPQRASSYAGTWKANVGSSSCRIQLSSVPSLDLYKASAQGCSDAALRTVNGWSFRDDQVVLFSRGQVIARLSGAEAALAGTLSSSKTELTMTR